MSYRPLAFVSGLTLGDYLLWNWSLNANHDVLALVSGLTLPPLALACAWMIALTLARMIGGSSRRTGRAGRAAASTRARAAVKGGATDARAVRTPAAGADGASASGASQSSSGKLAA